MLINVLMTNYSILLFHDKLIFLKLNNKCFYFNKKQQNCNITNTVFIPKAYGCRLKTEANIIKNKNVKIKL